MSYTGEIWTVSNMKDVTLDEFMAMILQIGVVASHEYKQMQRSTEHTVDLLSV